MKILILNWKDIKHPQVGGAEIIVYELAKRLVTDGHQVTWFCRKFVGGGESDSYDGINIVRRGNLLTMYWLAPWYYWRLAHKPELVIDVSNTIYWQSPLWARRSKVVAYLNQLAQEVFFYEYPIIVSRLGIFFERLQYLTYANTQFVCYSQSTKRDLVNVRIPSQNIHTFSLGIDHDRYYPGTKSTSPLFICVNRLVKMKRTDLVIRSMQTVNKTYPLARLVIVGTGYDRERLEALRSQLNLISSVSFADENVWHFAKNARDVKVKLMQQAWALVFPSVKEGWGMTVTECAACGTPAIVSAATGLVDSVVKDKTGFILSANPAPEEIAASMMKMISEPDLRKRLSRESIAWAKRFTWDRSYQQFKKILP